MSKVDAYLLISIFHCYFFIAFCTITKYDES